MTGRLRAPRCICGACLMRVKSLNWPGFPRDFASIAMLPPSDIAACGNCLANHLETAEIHMQMFKRIGWALALSLGVIAGGAAAADGGTKEEAKAMVDAAVEHVKKVGPEQAFKDFTADKANWTRKDLYVMAYDAKGTCVGHGANEKLIGKNLIELKDPNGKQLVKEMTDTAMSKGSGWVEYEWPHPQTKKIESKATFVRKLANYDGWVGVGIYR